MMINIEQSYYNTVSPEHVKEYGQFYTSENIANFMYEWLTNGKVNNVYDPAFGMGAFFDASFNFSKDVFFVANEIDEESYNFYLKNCNKNLENLCLRNVDYFSIWGEKDKYQAIICNPPYLKFQKVLQRDFIFQKLSEITGRKVSGYTNMASAFLIKAIYELADNGRLAFIMPLEFLNTGYGSVVKEYLLANGTIENIIQITDEKNVFESVITTVCVILFVKNLKKNYILFSKINDVSNIIPLECNRINLKDINVKDKWQRYFENAVQFSHQGFVPLASYGKFKRGIATGANEFFALNFSDLKKYNFKDSEYKYCITKSSQIKKSIFDQFDLNDLVKANENVFVLSLDKDNLSKEAESYIKLGEAKGFNHRYLTKNRKCWYELEHRTPSEILFGVFSRDSYKIIRNKTSSVTLTCYHGFTLSKNYETNIVDKLFIYLKSDLANKALNNNKRLYGDNLVKFEPNDLSKVLVPSLSQLNMMSDDFVKEQLNNIELYDCLNKQGNDFINSL